VTAYLLVFEAASSTTVHLPLDGVVVIGRAETAQVRLLDNSVSRAHARISMLGGRAEIADLGSQNGTKVNGEKIVGARALLSGDVVTILSVTLVFHSSSRVRPRRQMLGLDGFRQRVEDEIDRVARNRRSFGLAVITLVSSDPEAPSRVFDPIALARVVEPALRRIDVVALGGAELLVLMPEVDITASRERALGLLEALRAAAPRACGGVALAPADGNDFEIPVGRGPRRPRSGRARRGRARRRDLPRDRARRHRSDHRRSGDAAAHDPARSPGEDRAPRAGLRRDRDRQGAGRDRAATLVDPRGSPADRRQLRGADRDARRERAVRA